jgi:hypothetical protein
VITTMRLAVSPRLQPLYGRAGLRSCRSCWLF